MKTIILAAGLLLGGLAQAQASSVEQCDRARQSGKLKTLVAYTHCLNRAEASDLLQRYQYADLVRYIEARRLATAEKADKRLISPREVAAEGAETIAMVNTELQRRAQPAQQAQQKAVTFCNTLGASTICF